MCGILCLIQYGGKSVDVQKSCECLDQLNARGPDKQNYKIVKVNSNVEVFMGFTRLAIMDTTDAGLQPFELNDNYVICNGEIYNYKQLAEAHAIKMKTDCDCEVILPLYEQLGFLNMIKQLDAEFAMIFLDNQKKFINVARDRYGVRPLYYGYNKITKMVGFASELKALHPIMEFVEQIRPEQMVTVDFQVCRENFIDSVCFSPYYSYQNLVADPNLTDLDYIHKQINILLTDAVRKRLYADKPIAFLLSGGFDSSIIVSIATRILGPENIVCFSTGVDGSPDVEAAKVVVEYLGIKQHHIVPFSVKQGLAELPNVIECIETYDVTTTRASTPQYTLCKDINEKTNIRVLLSGEGSDEISGAYRYFRDAPNSEEFHRERVRLAEELCYFDNQRTDRSMAGNGLEVRVPFLDFAYVEFIMKINPLLLMFRPGQMEKQIIRDSFKGYLPDEILYRSKEAFSDAVSNNEVNWAKSIQSVAEKEITDEELANNGFEINTPMTKDALYFRRIFNQYYPGRDNVIPHYWLPKFQKEVVWDPSARVLKCY